MTCKIKWRINCVIVNNKFNVNLYSINMLYYILCAYYLPRRMCKTYCDHVMDVGTYLLTSFYQLSCAMGTTRQAAHSCGGRAASCSLLY